MHTDTLPCWLGSASKWINDKYMVLSKVQQGGYQNQIIDLLHHSANLFEGPIKVHKTDDIPS